MFVEGFTKEVPRYMQLADYFIGKPGPGSVSEALAMKLPVIVESNAWTLPQERYNGEWVRERASGWCCRISAASRARWTNCWSRRLSRPTAGRRSGSTTARSSKSRTSWREILG